MIKGVIFDLDGLLVDTEIISYKVYRDILSKYGYAFTIKDYAENYSGITEAINVNNLINRYNLPLSFDDCLNLSISTEKELLKQGVDLKPGAIELLNYLRENNIKIAVASSSTSERAIGILKNHGIDNMFDTYVFAEDIHNSKPDPEIFLLALEKFSIQNTECFVLEDSENGIEAAYRANIPVICIPDMKIPNKDYLDKTIGVYRTLNDVIILLEKSSN